MFIHREVRDAAARPEERLLRIPVAPILLHRVRRGLFREAVLQLDGDDRQAVQEQGEVERVSFVLPAVSKLPGDGEPVGAVALLRLRVFR